MHVCIHRGSKQIGGSCVEVESRGQRILIDLGLPLAVIHRYWVSLFLIPTLTYLYELIVVGKTVGSYRLASEGEISRWNGFATALFW